MNYETIPVRTHHGAVEINGVENMQALVDSIDRVRKVYWNDPELDRVFRFRVLTDPGFPFYDVSYVYGVMKDGTNVRVDVPFYQLPKSTWKSAIVEFARKDKVNAKRLGFFDPSVFSTVR
jgi:hypothetical protein